MTDEKLAYMANQIATAFRSKPHDQAARAVAEHVNAFWEPRMRSRLLERLDAGGAGLDPIVVAAAPEIRRPAAAGA